MQNELSDEQATDLARYYLGAGWKAYSNETHSRLINFAGEGHYFGVGWREAFRAAGVKLPARSRYTKQGTSVMLNGETIATCISGSKADLIAEALNAYAPPR